MEISIPFVKGHCGWDALTLLPEGVIPHARERDAALRIIDAPIGGGLEVGFLGPGERPNELRMRMVASTQRDWIPMCGGMTQVVGKALVETFLREHLSIDVSARKLTVHLVTDSGVVPIEIEIEAGRVHRTTTIMDGYAKFLYRSGVTPVVLDGVEALDTSEYLVFDIAALERAHPGIDFHPRSPGPQLDIINRLMESYRRHRRLETGVSGMMYERGGEGPGQFRIYPRFWSADGSASRVPFEFQCGTGTIAACVALAHHGLLPFAEGAGELLLEWGSQRATPDPYGIRTSQVSLGVSDRRIVQARFSHSVVEILAEGTLHLPAY